MKEQRAKRNVLGLARFAADRSWVPATSGNFSCRVSEHEIAITRSGVHKAELCEDDVVVISLDEAPPEDVSAETPLHVARYAADPSVGAIAHVHSVVAAVVSRIAGDVLRFAGYEMLKAFRGRETHEDAAELAVIPNSQDTVRLSSGVEERLAGLPASLPGYLLDGHGLYAWGRDVQETKRHLEAFDFLLRCELEERRCR